MRISVVREPNLSFGHSLRKPTVGTLHVSIIDNQTTQILLRSTSEIYISHS